jgi:hypothetical protein
MTDDTLPDVATLAELSEAEPLMRARAAMADPDAPATAEQSALPAAVTRRSPDQKSPAEWAYERLILYIQKFEESLGDGDEIAMAFTGGDGLADAVRIEGMGFFAPDLLSFYGRDATGARTQIVQHVSQLTVRLRALPKPEPEVAPRRIGFRLAEELERSDTSGG